AEARLKEAAKLGFSGALAPPRPEARDQSGAARGRGTGRSGGLRVREIPHLQDLVRLFTEGRVRRLDAGPRKPVAGGAG
ncbi:MAG: DNA repair protein RadA, partial [Proteobacteria bacterium]|nr:DNA repair protein RadA [Pseudomonadota bacterium]